MKPNARQAKLDELLNAARIWRYWHQQPVKRSTAESRRRVAAKGRLLTAIDDLLGEAGDLPETIDCPKCGYRSSNPHDIAEGYCGFCHDWTSPPSSS